jgi:hypothetical protein
MVNFLIEIYISQTIYFWNQETKPIEWFLRPEVPFFRNWTWKMSSATIYFQNQENINYYIVQFHIRSDFFFIGMEMQHIPNSHAFLESGDLVLLH